MRIANPLLSKYFWCSRRESNSLSPGYKSGASPAMLLEQNFLEEYCTLTSQDVGEQPNTAFI